MGVSKRVLPRVKEVFGHSNISKAISGVDKDKINRLDLALSPFEHG